MSSAEGMKALLTQTRIRDLIAGGKPVHAVGHNVNVGAVLELLSSNSILSAPVFLADAGGAPTPNLQSLLGFVDVWAVLCAFLQSLPLPGLSPGGLTAEQLDAHGAALCARPVTSLFDAPVKAAAEASGGSSPAPVCADYDVHDDPDSSVLEVVRSCFLPRLPPPSAGLLSWGSGAGFAAASPRVSAANALAGSPGSNAWPAAAPGAGAGPGHARHPAASHRIVVRAPDGSLAVLSQTDILRFLAAHHDSLRPLGKASLAELGLATGSLHLAAGPPNVLRPPPLAAAAAPGNSGAHSSGGANSGGAGVPPSSPKPPLAGVSAGGAGGSSVLAGLTGSSPVGESYLMQRAGSGAGPMQMSPPASPRVSGSPRLSSSHLGSAAGHRAAARRQLVAVHESVTALEAFRVLLQQRVSAVAVLAGAGGQHNMRLVGNLSATDLRHLKPGGFGCLALSVKQFLASKPLAPDQAIPVAAPPSPGGQALRAPVIMAHAPGVYTCQATASLEELVRMLGAPTHGIHRVYVVDPDQRPAGVVTGTDVLSLLSTACN